jgi:Phosphotransferase enzyme family
MSATSPMAIPTRQATWDAALPGLAHAFDPAAIGRLLADRGFVVPGAGLAIRHVRYHPGRSAQIAYEVTGAGDTLLFYGALTAPGIEPLAGHERDAGSGSGEGGERHVLLPEIPMVVRRFPHDPVLRRLPEVWTLRPFARRLDALLGEDLGSWKLTRRDAVVVRYKPERRCVFRLNVTARERSGGRKRRREFFGQVDADGTASRVAPVVTALASREGTYGPIPVARPVFEDPTLGLMMSEGIAGSPLPLHLMRDDARKILRRLATRLADIHRSGVEPSRTLTNTERYQALAAAVASLAAVDEARRMGFASRAIALCDELAADQPSGNLIPSGCLHGDFHPGQVIVRAQRPWIIDFDRTAIGDPLHDLAAFTAALLIDVGEGRMAARPTRRAVRTFLRSYVAAWPEVWDSARYAWHVSAALLEATVAPLRQLQAGWPMLVSERLRLAESAVRKGLILP